LRLTAAGRRALDGDADHVALNGIDRWIAAAHLNGHAVRWGWNDATEAIVTATGT
jgi:hypothetical protein